MTDADGSVISRLLAESRRGLDRVEPADLAAVRAAGALIVDIRPVDQRRRDGELPDAVVIDRNVLEWRLDPTSPHRLSMSHDPDRRIVLVCSEGYSSSLAAHTLQRLGLPNATDLCGGYRAWSAQRRTVAGPTGADLGQATGLRCPQVESTAATSHNRHMVLVEAAFVIGLVGAMVYGITLLLMRPQEQRRPAPRSGTWQVAHYDAKGETHVVLQRVPESGTGVLDEHVVATFRSDDPDYDEKFLAAMSTARQRQALFETEEDA